MSAFGRKLSSSRTRGGRPASSSVTRGRKPASSSVILVLGKPASGKSTLGRSLALRLGCKSLDVGAHVRESEPLAPGTDLEDFVMGSVSETLAAESNVLLIGFPKLERGLKFLQSKASITLAIVLEVADDGVLIERAAQRHRSGERPEDDPTFFLSRVDAFYTRTEPVIDVLRRQGLACCIDASGSRSDVEEQAYQAIARALASPAHGSRERCDPEEADFEVSVCLLSGEERLRPLLPPRATIGKLRAALIANGEKDCDLKLSFNSMILDDSMQIRELDGFKPGCVISMSRIEKPPPPPPPVDRGPCSRCGGPHTRSDCVCFTADSSAAILRDGIQVQCLFSDLKIGDMIHTGESGNSPYRRILKIWDHHWQGSICTYELAPGCRLTPGHPIYIGGKWLKPEDICAGDNTYEEVVYQLEIEGHVDTALVGGYVCALLGRYCGPDFGWNVFTRKTEQCDQQPCLKCEKAVVPGLSFDPLKLPSHMLPPAVFEPY